MLKNNSKHENRVQAKLTAGSQFGTDCGLERWQRTRRGADPRGDGHRVGPEPGSLRVRRDPEDLGDFLTGPPAEHLQDEGSEAPRGPTVRGAVPPKTRRGFCGAAACSAPCLCSQGAGGLSFNSSIPPRHGLTALAAARAPGRSWPKVTPELLGVPAPGTSGEEGSGSPSENPSLIQQQENAFFVFFKGKKKPFGVPAPERSSPKAPSPPAHPSLPAQASSRTPGCSPAARGRLQTPKRSPNGVSTHHLPPANRF